MSFANWKKKTKTLNEILWLNRKAVERACQAAYKAGERDGRKQVDVMARSAIKLRDTLKYAINEEAPK
jgi:hypothetical protein